MCYTYDNLSRVTARTGTTSVIFGYNGRDGVITENNGLIYMRARYYSPDMKRFINADIVAGSISNAITLNRFAYANGNPVSFVDPFGLSADEEPLTDEEYYNSLYVLRSIVGLSKVHSSLTKIKDAILSFAKISTLEVGCDFRLGNLRYYYNVSHTMENDKIDNTSLRKAINEQIDISSSYDFSNGTFHKYSLDENINITFSADFNEYTTAEATIILKPGDSFAAEYIVETSPKDSDGQTITTTFGLEANLPKPKNNTEQAPNTIPESNNEPSWQAKILYGMVNGYLQAREKSQNFFDDFGKAIGKAFEDFFNSPLPIFPFGIPLLA
jgi:RHS repeat-associated protein